MPRATAKVICLCPPQRSIKAPSSADLRTLFVCLLVLHSIVYSSSGTRTFCRYMCASLATCQIFGTYKQETRANLRWIKLYKIGGACSNNIFVKFEQSYIVLGLYLNNNVFVLSYHTPLFSRVNLSGVGGRGARGAIFVPSVIYLELKYVRTPWCN